MTQEFEVYLKQATKYVVDYLNNERNYTDTIKDMKVTFDLDAQQEAAIRIVLANLDYMDSYINQDDLKPIAGFNCNVIANILLKEWNVLNNETLV